MFLPLFTAAFAWAVSGLRDALSDRFYKTSVEVAGIVGKRLSYIIKLRTPVSSNYARQFTIEIVSWDEDDGFHFDSVDPDVVLPYVVAWVTKSHDVEMTLTNFKFVAQENGLNSERAYMIWSAYNNAFHAGLVPTSLHKTFSAPQKTAKEIAENPSVVEKLKNAPNKVADEIGNLFENHMNYLKALPWVLGGFGILIVGAYVFPTIARQYVKR